MALPGLGTVVRYHVAAGVDAPAIVIGTPGTWTSDMTTFYGNPGPSANHVALTYWGTNTGPAVANAYSVAEGTSAGQFSTLTLEAEDV